MELTEKFLIHNEHEAQSLIDTWNSQKISHFLSVDDFEKFPAVVCSYIDENDYNMTYWGRAYYSITYKDDFDE